MSINGLAGMGGRWSHTGPAKQANSDARTLARYLQALGVNTNAEHLNDLLTLLAVLMIEAGGGLSLALGMALGVGATTNRERPQAPAMSESPDGTGRPTGAPAADVRPVCPTPPVIVREPTAVTVRPPDDAPDGALVGWLRGHGGRVVGVRRLADAIGRSRTTVSDQLRRLASQGRVSLTPGRRGLVIELAPAVRSN
jgi:hypothetical protein